MQKIKILIAIFFLMFFLMPKNVKAIVSINNVNTQKNIDVNMDEILENSGNQISNEDEKTLKEYEKNQKMEGIFTLLLIPILVPGIIFGVVILAVIIFFIKKYRKTRKLIYYILPIIIVIPLIIFSIVILPPEKGKAIDVISGKPISGIQVMRVVEITSAVPNPGGETAHVKWHDSVIADESGNYHFPFKLRFKNPLFTIFDSAYLTIPICTYDKYELNNPNRNCMRYWDNYSSDGPIIYSNQKFEEKYNSYYYIFNNKKNKFLEYTELGTYWSNGSLYNQGRFYFPSDKIIYLIPKINDIADCQKIVKKELTQDCQKVNANRLAVQTRDPEICNYVKLSYRDYCVTNVAITNKDEIICDEMIKIFGESGKYKKDDCLRKVAIEKQDSQLCNSVAESKWFLQGIRGTCLWCFIDSKGKESCH